jgi:YD repeat-containing protein
MRTSPVTTIFVLLVAVLLSLSTVGSSASSPPPAMDPLSAESLITSYHTELETSGEKSPKSRDEQVPGIKEEIPAKYANRYQEWKDEFLATEAGRTQWESYKTSPNFTLTIAVSRDNAEGATTGKYKWNEAGQLVAATITLGSRLDEGYPNPIYFPVMNSLVPSATSDRINGNTLAATKLAHEFGHVNRTGKVDSAKYQLQSLLMPQYNKIFLANGRNPNDPKLLEIVEKLGGTPVEIWEDREYWGEANAMVYLRDRFTEDGMRCSIFSKIRHSVDLYAKNYEPRFSEVARSSSNRRTCGWQ